VTADATDPARLGDLARGAAVLYNCANPPYDRWLTDWPPLNLALLQAAESSGAVLACAGNAYGYGPVAGPITDTTPLAATQPKLKLRADLWRDALAAHQAGKIRVTEVRASDYDAPAPRLTSMPYPALWTAGLFNATVKELRHTYYQWSRPFVIDSAVTERELGLTPVPIDSALANVLR
jgi:hypothetical protein